MNIARILQHNVIGKLLNHGLVFLVNILVVRLTGAAASGHYFNELYVLNIIVFIFSAGLDYSAVALIARNPSLVKKIHRHLGLMVIFFILVMVAWAFISLPNMNGYFRQPAWAMVLFSTGNLLLVFYQGVLSALKKFNLQNILLGVTNLLFLSYLYWTYLERHEAPVEDIAILYAVLFLIQGTLMFLFSLPASNAQEVHLPRAAFYRSGLLIMASSLLYFIFLRADNFFVQKYSTGVTLGNYVQCGKIGQYFLYFSSIISSTLLPFLSAESAITGYRDWYKLMRPYVFLIILAAVLIALFGHAAFPWLFGSEFKEMNGLMIILLPGYVCLGMLTLINAVYISRGNIRYLFWGDLGGLVLLLLLDLWLVPDGGAYTAAAISSSCYILLFLYLLAGLKRQFTVTS